MPLWRFDEEMRTWSEEFIRSATAGANTVARLVTAAVKPAFFDRPKDAAGDVAVDGYDQHRISRTGSARSMSYSTLDFEGILTVGDPGTLLPAIAHGFGAAKAYGCGLMLVQRV